MEYLTALAAAWVGCILFGRMVYGAWPWEWRRTWYATSREMDELRSLLDAYRSVGGDAVRWTHPLITSERTSMVVTLTMRDGYYETHDSEAATVAAILGLALTKDQQGRPLCRFIKWYIDEYRRDLETAGYEVITLNPI